jgi:hypothetical protein
MIITELIDHLTIIAKKNPNLIVHDSGQTENGYLKIEKIDSKFFKIGHVKKSKYYDDDIDECEPEEASDFLIQ